MFKKEIIWRELLHQTLAKKKNKFQQKELAKKFGFSLSTINNALKIPRRLGAVKVSGRFFVLESPEKMLYLWGTFRNLEKDIVYKTYIEKSPKEIENLMPPGVIYGAYSAFIKRFNRAPADYDKVYIYAADSILPELKKRFPVKTKKALPNLIVLRADKFLKQYGKITTIGQTFVDIWNLTDWYAQDFYKNFKEELNAILA